MFYVRIKRIYVYLILYFDMLVKIKANKQEIKKKELEQHRNELAKCE
jgi:hypothetical protein